MGRSPHTNRRVKGSNTLRGREVELVIVFLVLSLGWLSDSYIDHWAPTLQTVAQASPSPSAVVAVSPSNISSTGLSPGQFVTFTVNITNSPPISLFKVYLQYNSFVLQASYPEANGYPYGVDYTGNVLGLGAQLLGICVDDKLGGDCGPTDNQGIVSLALNLLGVGTSPNPTNGLLFKVKLKVIDIGFSTIHILEVILTTGAGLIPSRAVDGYFTNKDCASGVLCTPPIPAFTYSPSRVSAGGQVNFNASASMATNPGATIRDYYWSWGDQYFAQHVRAPGITHVYSYPGNFSISLTVTDSDGIVAIKSITLSVSYLFISLIVAQVRASPQFHVNAGSPVNITAIVINNSTLPEDANLTISLPGHILGGKTSTVAHLSPYGDQAQLSVVWNTAGYAPRMYRLDAVAIQPAGANITANSLKSVYIQIVDPQLAGFLGLDLLKTLSLGVLLIAAVGVTTAIITGRRKPSYESEPL